MGRRKRGGRGGTKRNPGAAARVPVLPVQPPDAGANLAGRWISSAAQGINTNPGAAAHAPVPPVQQPPAAGANLAGRRISSPAQGINTNPGAAAHAPVLPVQQPSAAGANLAFLAGGSSVQRVGPFNYWQECTSYCPAFYNFLVSNTAYEGQLRATKGMNDAYHRSDPYAIHISHDDMWNFNAKAGLIINTCNSRNDLERWLLPAARQFVRKFLNDIGTKINVETIISGTCLSLSGFPESMLLLRDFRKSNALVQRMSLFKGKTSIVVPTIHGSHFMKIFLVGILAKHYRNISWDGNFCEEDIVIIKWRSKSDDQTYTYEMKMIHKPVEAKGLHLYNAMVKDLLKAAAIIEPLYKDGQDWPVYFVELIQELELVTNLLVRQPIFIEFLSNHPALMLPADRRSFLMTLRDKICNRGIHKLPTSLSNLTTYEDWTKIVRTEMSDLNVLGAVYNHVSTAPYRNTTFDLINFLRNTCQHVKQTKHCEAELYLARLFSKVLPSIMWILLQTGDMEAIFGEAWSDYKRSR